MRVLLVFAAFGHLAIASLTHVLGRQVVAGEGVPPEVTVTLRCLVAAAILAPTFLFAGRSRTPLSASDRARMLVIMALAVPANQFCYLLGLRYAPAVHGALLFCLMPLFLAIYDAASGRSVAPPATWAGSAIAVGGVVIVLEEHGLHLSTSAVLGDFILLASVLAWCGVTILSRPLLGRMPSFTITRLTLIGGTLLLLPLTASSMVGFEFRSLSARAIACILFLGTFTSVVAYLLWYTLLRRIGPLRCAILLNLQPVGTGLLAWLMLGEPLSGQLVAGGLLVLAGVLVVQLSEARHVARTRIADPERVTIA